MTRKHHRKRKKHQCPQKKAGKNIDDPCIAAIAGILIPFTTGWTSFLWAKIRDYRGGVASLNLYQTSGVQLIREQIRSQEVKDRNTQFSKFSQKFPQIWRAPGKLQAPPVTIVTSTHEPCLTLAGAHRHSGVELGAWLRSNGSFFGSSQWIGLGENSQENLIFNGKNPWVSCKLSLTLW